MAKGWHVGHHALAEHTLRVLSTGDKGRGNSFQSTVPSPFKLLRDRTRGAPGGGSKSMLQVVDHSNLKLVQDQVGVGSIGMLVGASPLQVMGYGERQKVGKQLHKSRIRALYQ